MDADDPALTALRRRIESQVDWHAVEVLALAGLQASSLPRPEVRDYLDHRYAGALSAVRLMRPERPPRVRVTGSREHDGGDVTVSVTARRIPFAAPSFRIRVRPSDDGEFRLVDVRVGNYSALADLRAAYFERWQDIEGGKLPTSIER